MINMPSYVFLTKILSNIYLIQVSYTGKILYNLILIQT